MASIRPSQRYVSEELSHFVGRTLKSEDEQYELLIRILTSGWLKHGPFGPGFEVEDGVLPYTGGGMVIDPSQPFSSEKMYAPSVVCFCDIPVDDLAVHVGKYSRFGLSFQKAFLVGMGALPVWYVARDSRLESGLGTWSDVFDQLVPHIHDEFWKGDFPTLDDVKAAMASDQPASPPESAGRIALRWLLRSGVFAFVKFFDSTLADNDPDNFYMERA